MNPSFMNFISIALVEYNDKGDIVFLNKQAEVILKNEFKFNENSINVLELFGVNNEKNSTDQFIVVAGQLNSFNVSKFEDEDRFFIQIEQVEKADSTNFNLSEIKETIFSLGREADNLIRKSFNVIDELPLSILISSYL